MAIEGLLGRVGLSARDKDICHVDECVNDRPDTLCTQRTESLKFATTESVPRFWHLIRET